MSFAVLGAEQERLGRIDTPVSRILIDPGIAEHQVLLASGALGEIHRGTSVGRETPQVVMIVEENACSVFRPARDPVGDRRAGGIVIFSPELHAAIGSEVGCFAVRHRQRDPILAIEEDGVVAGGGPTHAAGMLLDEQLAGAGVVVDQVGVGIALAVFGHRPVFSIIGSDGVTAIGAGRQIGHFAIGKRDDLAVPDEIEPRGRSDSVPSEREPSAWVECSHPSSARGRRKRDPPLGCRWAFVEPVSGRIRKRRSGHLLRSL